MRRVEKRHWQAVWRCDACGLERDTEPKRDHLYACKGPSRRMLCREFVDRRVRTLRALSTGTMFEIPSGVEVAVVETHRGRFVLRSDEGLYALRVHRDAFVLADRRAA